MVDTQKLSYYYYIHINHYYYLAVSNNLLTTLPKNDETMLKSLRINNDLCYSYNTYRLIHMSLIFEKLSLKLFSKIKLDKLDFQSILNQIFAGYIGSNIFILNNIGIDYFLGLFVVVVAPSVVAPSVSEYLLFI